MEVRFDTPALCRTCNRHAAMVKRWGDGPATAVGQHLQELDAVENLADLAQFPHLRLTREGADGRAWLDGAEGVRVRIRWQLSQEVGDEDDSWKQVKAIVVETIVIDGEEAHEQSDD